MDLTNLSPADLAALKAALDGLSNTAGRSPVRTGPYKDPRQLDNLTLVPRANDPRPAFFWSAEEPRSGDTRRTTLYPMLMWSPQGAEITVEHAKDRARYEEQGYVTVAPSNAVAADPADVIRAQIARLSPEDQAELIAAAKADRLARVREAMAGLSEADMDALAASIAPAAEPVKSR